MAFDASREGQLEEKSLRRGYWWLTHKAQVRRGAIAALIALDLALVGYGSFGFVDWFFLSGVRERADTAQMVQRWTDFGAFRSRNAPQDISMEPAVVLGAGTGAFDVAARVTNPNLKWRVSFDHHFDLGGASTPSRAGIVLPGETRWLYALGQRDVARPSSARLVIENVKWQRVDPHLTLPDYATWAAQRLDIRITDATYEGPRPQDPVAVGKAKFTVTNATAYGYYNVGFFVALYSGSRVTGVNRVAVSELRPGEVKHVEATWSSDLPTATRVEVRPEIDIFDAGAYIPAGR